MSGDDYRRARAQAAWALEALNKIVPAEIIDGLDWRWLAEQVGTFAGKFSRRRQPNSPRAIPKSSLAGLLRDAASSERFSRASSFGRCSTAAASRPCRPAIGC